VTGFHIFPNNLPIILLLRTIVLSKGTRFGIDPTAASTLLFLVRPCSTQVVLKHETRCLNVKLLNFSGLAQIIQNPWEIQRGRSECIPEGEGKGEGGGDGGGGEARRSQ
jgi:hypothetical protein